MEPLDLDAARAARAEANGEPRSFILSGETFELPVELAWDFTEVFSSGEVTRILEYLLGPSQFERFRNLEPKPTDPDVTALVEALPQFYGPAAGESPASSASSKKTSRHLRPTSSGSTG